MPLPSLSRSNALLPPTLCSLRSSHAETWLCFRVDLSSGPPRSRGHSPELITEWHLPKIMQDRERFLFTRKVRTRLRPNGGGATEWWALVLKRARLRRPHGLRRSSGCDLTR